MSLLFNLLFESRLVLVYGILGGQIINIEDAPYQVNYGDVCGGVLLHRRWALTTAHCGKQIFIRVGSTERLRGRETKVILHIIHPDYGKEHEFDYDLQLLQLKRNLHLYKDVQTIGIGRGDLNIFVAGWGYPKEKGQYLSILHQIQIKMLPFDKCQSYNRSCYNHTLTPRMFCTEGRDKDACQGDSGSGAVSNDNLIGISSFGYGCGRGYPGVYINVTEPSVRNWIRVVAGV